MKSNPLVVLVLTAIAGSQNIPYPRNAVACERCHNIPNEFGSSSITVQREGILSDGKFLPGSEGGIRHRNGESALHGNLAKPILGTRVSLSLLGDGYIEAIDSKDLSANANQQLGMSEVKGVTILAPVLETNLLKPQMQVGRFGWKDQHTSLLSSSADSLRNELGIRNRLYPDEYPTHVANNRSTPFDNPDPKTGKTELDRLVGEIRHAAPPERDAATAATSDAQAGEKIFGDVGCAICHVPSYKTLPPGTRINGGTYKVPKFIGNKIIHPYSDFLLHDVGTGDGIPQAARPEFLDQSTANKFRTPPLWGLRYRTGLMHDGDTPGTETAIKLHGGEATAVRQRYEHLTPEQQKQLQVFLKSL